MKCLLLVLAGLATAAALSLQASDSKARALEYASTAATDKEARSFWAAQWDALEADLEHFRDVAASIAFSAVSALQLTEPGKQVSAIGKQAKATKVAVAALGKGKAPPSPAATPAAQQLAPSAAAGALKDAKRLAGKELTTADVAKLSASLGGASLSKSSEASAMMLRPMLAMLKDQYASARTKISELNKREASQKKAFEEREKKHQQKLLRINSTKFSAEFRANETRDEIRQFRYFYRSRELQHKQYHNMLKLEHSMMQKEKTMIEMYEKTLSGKGSSSVVKKELHQLGGEMPEVVLLQAAQEAKKFYLDSMPEIRLNLLQLSHTDCPYCAAQCLDKCHAGGGSYGTCLTQCADAGKSL